MRFSIDESFKWSGKNLFKDEKSLICSDLQFYLRRRDMLRWRGCWSRRRICPCRWWSGWRRPTCARSRPPRRTSCTLLLGKFPKKSSTSINFLSSTLHYEKRTHISLKGPLGLAVGLAEFTPENDLFVLLFHGHLIFEMFNPLLVFLKLH